MKYFRVSLAAIATASALASTLAFAKDPVPTAAANPSSTSAKPTSATPSNIDRVKSWTEDEWNEAVKEWAQDKAKWAGCQQKSAVQKLSGRKSWTFLYKCMTK